MTLNQPIGIFDSGVGGLSVARCIRSRLPHEDLLYIADSLYAPYGDKSEQYIIERASDLTRYMLGQGAKAIVVACNTATVLAISHLRSVFDIPIIGVEPGVKPAVGGSRSGVVGVLATSRTVQSRSLQSLMQRFAGPAEVLLQACPGLVEQVENLALDSEETRVLLRRYIEPLLARQMDTLVLGCTHYPFLMPVICDLVGPDVEVIDTGAAVAREVERRLLAAGLSRNASQPGQERFVSSHHPQQSHRVIERLWGAPVRVEPLVCTPAIS